MATPVGGTYSVGSGQTLYAGMTSPGGVSVAGMNSTQASSSTSGAITINDGSEPLWLQGLAVNEWTEIAGSAMSNTPPTVHPGGTSGDASARMDAWCGLCIDTRTSDIWSLANGGHTDYYGNETLKFPLAANAPTWEERLVSSASGAVTFSAARYSDGRPASCHTYYSHQFIEARNRAMRFGTFATATNGDSFAAVDGFDCTAAQGVNGWDAAGTYPALPGITYAGETSCKNPVTEDIYYFLNNTSVHKWTQATNTWSQINDGWPPISPVETPAAYDTSRDRIFLLRPAEGSRHTFDPATGLFTEQTLTGTVAAINAAGPGIGMVYEPVLDAYLVRLRAAGGTVYKIDAATFAVTTLSTTGGAAIPITTDISGTPENVYNRFLYVPNLKGIVYFPHYSANAWFLRTHS